MRINIVEDLKYVNGMKRFLLHFKKSHVSTVTIYDCTFRKVYKTLFGTRYILKMELEEAKDKASNNIDK